MGNCQAAEAAAVVVQHPGPGGRLERLYWPTSAAEVMRNNPGHYVALVTLRVLESNGSGNGGNGGKQVRLTRVKLLKPKDTLLLGQVYRLITSQEVTKALRERKNEKFKNLDRPDYIPKTATSTLNNKEITGTHSQNTDQRGTSTSSSSNTQRNRQNWRPSLRRIDEIGT